MDPNGLAVQPQEQADLVAKESHELRAGRECRIGFVDAESAPVVPSPSLVDQRDVCGSFTVHTSTGADNLHPAWHLTRL